jgi:predicted aldo/keto reductase-like oxidoreductase
MRFEKFASESDLDQSAEIVRKANELGINYFDTAPVYYCGGKSEDIFGRAFKNMPSDFYVSTKSHERSGDVLRRQLENSLKKMGISKINFFHIWCILTLDDYRGRMVKGGAYEAALKAKDEGLIDHIVFSTHCNGNEVETIVNEGAFEGVTIGYNILNFPFRQAGLKAAYEKGLGIATMNPLGGGQIPQRAEYFDFIKGTDDESVVEAALRFNASHKEITTVLAGIGNMEQLYQNVKVGKKPEAFSENKINEIKERLSQSMDELCTGCRYCESCPQEIEISKFMIAYNQKILGSIDIGKNWFGEHWGMTSDDASKCIECGECESKCTQHLPISKRLKEITNW